MSYATRVTLARIGLFALAAAALELLPRLGFGNRLAILPFTEMLKGLGAVVASGEVWPHLALSLGSIVSAFVLAAVLGVAIGYLLWRMPRVYAALSPYLVSYYAIPIFAFYPILILLFGANRLPILFLALGWAIVAVVVSTVEGLGKLRQSWEKVAETYGLGLWERALSVHLPAAWPNVATGLRLAATYSILGVIASEFILSDGGLGYMVNHFYNSFEMQSMWGGIIVVFIVGVSLDTAVRRTTRALVAGR